MGMPKIREDINNINLRLANMVTNVKSFGAKGDGITDDTIAIQNAINSLSVGGVIFFPKGTYMCGSIKIKSRVILKGEGFVSILLAKAGLIDHFISLYDLNTVRSGISDLLIDGNKDNQINTFDIVNFTGDGGSQDELDSNFQFANITIRNCKGNGITLTGNRIIGSVLNNVSIYWCRGHGFYVTGSDTYFVNCVAWGNGKNGIHNIGGNNLYSNCKSYWNGYSGDFTNFGDGFYLGDSSIGTKLSNCEAQENGRNGLSLVGATNVLVSAFVSDSNASLNIDGFAYFLDGASNCVINGNMYNRSSMAGNQKYGINMINVTKRLLNNTLDIIMANQSTTKPMIPLLGKVITTNRVTINGIVRNQRNMFYPYENMNNDSNEDGIVDGLNYYKSSTINGSATFDALEQCQKADITGGTTIGNINFSMNKKCKANDKLAFYFVGKVVGNVNILAQINYYQGTNYISNAVGATFTSTQEQNSGIFESVAPPLTDNCTFQILTRPVNIGDVGSSYIKYVEAVNYSICNTSDINSQVSNAVKAVETCFNVLEESNIYNLDISKSYNFIVKPLNSMAKTIKFTNAPSLALNTIRNINMILSFSNNAPLTFPSSVIWKDGIAPTFVVGKKYMLQFTLYDDNIGYFTRIVNEW